MAVLGNSGSHGSALESAHLPIPLGMTLTTLGVMVLGAYVFDRVSRRKKNGAASVSIDSGNHLLSNVGAAPAKRSIATELALLSELSSQGALSAAEFEAAKRRVLHN
ncbi:hypothetical protein BJ956_000046 [Arthrobacter psychrochitiniphilus]|nr:hypothetical protein [Arthrobacter psychrochitiniphilus]